MMIVDHATSLATIGAGIYVGTDPIDGTPAFADSRDVVTVLGRQGSGKSTRVFAPSVAVHYGPVVYASTRSRGKYPDVKEVTLHSRTAISEGLGGSVEELTLDAGFEVLGRPVWWSLLDGLDGWNSCLDRAQSLAEAGIQNDRENASAWREYTSQLLAVILYWYHDQEGVTDDHLLEVISDANADTFAWLLDQCQTHGAPNRVLHVLRSLATANDENTRNVRDEVTSSLLKGHLRERHHAASDFSTHDFVRSFGTLYVTARRSIAEQHRALVGALVETIVDAWLSAYEKGQTPPGATLLLAIDEARYICPAGRLPDIFTTGGGSGIQTLLGFQMPSQASEIWGKDGEVLTSSANHLIILPGLQDEPFLQRFASLSGDEPRQRIDTRPSPEFLQSRSPIPLTILLEHATEIWAILDAKHPRMAASEIRVARRRHEIQLAQLGIPRRLLADYRPEELAIRVPVTERLPKFTVAELRGAGLAADEALVISGDLPVRRMFNVWRFDPVFGDLLAGPTGA